MIDPEHLEIHRRRKPLKRIAALRQRRIPLIKIKEPWLPRHQSLHRRWNGLNQQNPAKARFLEASNRADALPLPAQYPGLHDLFSCQRCSLICEGATLQVGQFYLGGPGQFCIGANLRTSPLVRAIQTASRLNSSLCLDARICHP